MLKHTQKRRKLCLSATCLAAKLRLITRHAAKKPAFGGKRRAAQSPKCLFRKFSKHFLNIEKKVSKYLENPSKYLLSEKNK